jgi:hypothetical protein
MASILKSLFSGLFSGGGGGAAKTAEAEPIEYEGYLIRPTPYGRNGQFQTCGVIEKEINGERKEHRFVRAESHPSVEQAVEFSITKAKQMIDYQGDRIFRDA